MHGLFVTGSTCDNDDEDFRENRLKFATQVLRMIRLLNLEQFQSFSRTISDVVNFEHLCTLHLADVDGSEMKEWKSGRVTAEDRGCRNIRSLGSVLRIPYNIFTVLIQSLKGCTW